MNNAGLSLFTRLQLSNEYRERLLFLPLSEYAHYRVE